MSLTCKKGFSLRHQLFGNLIMHKRNNVVKIIGINFFLFTFSLIFVSLSSNVEGQTSKTVKPSGRSFQIPEDYLREAENIPSFWLTNC